MFELYFITSNTTKLAHFTHIAEKFGVRIIGFRERTYYGSYDEPDSSSREVVLSKSYESALDKWVRSGLPATSMFFFEDTSVRIDALSSAEEDFPGTRIKFWMRETSFDELNQSLKKRSRRASIRSDIVLHLPEQIRKYLGLEDVYCGFQGSISGCIAKHKSDRDSANLLYPWLDPKTFSGWLVPDGEVEVLSDLNISSADKHDFRLRSFESMLSFLRGLHVNLGTDVKRPIQGSLDFIPARKIVVFLGKTCAGKTTAARELSKNGHAIHLEASDFMRAELVRRHGRRSSVPVREFASAVLREEPWIVPGQMIDIINKFPNTNFVVSGLRSGEEIEVLNRGLKGEAAICVWVAANQRLRFERSVARNRDGRASIFADFQREDAIQSQMGLGSLGRKKGNIKLRNEGCLEDYLEEARKVASLEASGDAEAVRAALDALLGSLERRLILALGRLGGDKRYFTSGQLAAFTRDPASGFAEINKG
jgi:dephospho-CoA kinase/inosine/xanthosine triphosphate pyrophosphatase family protein